MNLGLWAIGLVIVFCIIKGIVAPLAPAMNCAIDDITHYTACETIEEPDSD